MPKPTPIYSAFAIVSIESIWPSSDGDEVPINYQDLVLLEERISGGSEAFNQRQEGLVSRQNKIKEDSLAAATKLQELLTSPLSEFSVNYISATNDTTAYKEFTSSDVSISGDLNPTALLRTISRLYTSNNSLLEGFIEENGIHKDSTNRFVGQYQTQDDYIKALTDEVERLKGIVEENNDFKKLNTLIEENDAIESELLDRSAYGTYPQASRRPGFSSILTSEEAYKKRRGYFKLLPLNIIQVSSSTSTGGTVGQSSFNVSFTMDDVLIIADRFAAENITSTLPRAIPIKIDEVFNEVSKIFGNSPVPEKIKSEINPYGMYAFRISGNEFTFNIEDVVEANDTVTMWLYHDPKEFDFINLDSSDSSKSAFDKFVLNKDFSSVIGSGSRRSQDDFKLLNEDGTLFRKTPKTLVQSIFFKTGVLNSFSSPESLLPGQGQEVRLSRLDAFNFLVESGRILNLDGLGANFSEVISPDNPALNLSISGVTSKIISRSDNNQRTNFGDSGVSILQGQLNNFIRNTFIAKIKDFNLAAERRARGNSSESGGAPKLIPETSLSYQASATAFISSVREILQLNPDANARDLATSWRDLQARKKIPSLAGVSLTEIFLTNPGELTIPGEAEDYFQTIINYVNTLNLLAEESLSFLSEQNQINVVSAGSSEEGFFNKKTYFSTVSHGETPYLILKGHISSVEVKYGATQGSNTVTISGGGYEKVLNDNIVYYEDLFSPTGGTFGQALEAYPIYSQMLPPRALLSFIESNVPRFMLIGKPTKQIIDARNMSLQFAAARRASDYQVTEEDEVRATGTFQQEEIKRPRNIVEDYFDSGKALVRGLGAIDINVNTVETLPELRSSGDSQNESKFEFGKVSLRLFYPVNYLNTSRIREMINSLEAAYEQNPDEAVIKIPIKLSPMQPVSNNLMTFNGPKEINHLFVDETGRLRQRLSFEAWERVPNPEYTPIITDNDVLAAGSSFSRNSEPVTTMVDIRANYLTTGRGIVDARFAGRTLSGGNDYIPLIVIKNENFNNERLLGDGSNFYETISEPFFRYGMKYKLLNDVYTTSTRIAKRRSILYQGFFSKPIKTASVNIKGNPSYRAGETVLVCLNSYKYRSREIVDVNKTLDWLRYLKTNKELIPLYIGVDKRWINRDTYFATSKLGESKEYNFWLGPLLGAASPEEYILDKFIETFTYLKNTLDGGLKFITPEYFPTTLWGFLGTSNSYFFNGINSASVRAAHNIVYNQLTGRTTGSLKSILDNNPDLINSIRMQNFKATSYYIESVQHSYVHGESVTTKLNLNHGQDNLVLLEPFSMRPIGFMSIERKMRIGYDDIIVNSQGDAVFPDSPDTNTKDRILWEEFNTKQSDLQKFYTVQFFQDAEFKRNSFLYTAQKYRNSANFMYEIALELGLVK
jgi:hypothetical protein